MELEEGLERLQGFLRTRPTLLVGTGLSMSMGLPGMAELKGWLEAEISRACKDDARLRDEWDRCLPMISVHGLEEGLAEIPVSQELLTLIVAKTAAFVREKDDELRRQLYGSAPPGFPFARLLKHLVDSLPPGEQVLDVVTPNYDHVVEYACDAVSLPCCTGFVGTRVQVFVPDVLGAHYYMKVRVSDTRRRPHYEYRKASKVRLLKPHGSLYWQRRDGVTYQCPEPIEGASRVLVTPGLTKYAVSLTDSVMNHIRETANDSLRRARSVLVIGYGFNDPHLQTVLEERLASGMSCVVLAKNLTSRARAVALRHRSVLALEDDDTCGTRWHSSDEEGVWDKPLWDLDCFMSTVIG